MSGHYSESSPKDKRSGGFPIRRSHHEGRGRIEHRTIRELVAC